MLVTTFLATSLLIGQDAKPVSLGRTFTKGEKLTYQVKSNLQVDQKQLGIETWIPQEEDVNYTFTTEVQEIKADGIAVLRYKRPSVTVIEGQTFTSPMKTTVEKTNDDLRLTLSPVNTVLDFEDLSKKATSGKKGVKVSGAFGAPQGQLFGQFIQEIYRLSLFVGSFESSLDFAPRLPLYPVKVGDSWKQTVSYQPQKLKGKKEELAVQRLDYTYTYKGKGTLNGKPVEKVVASLSFNNDLAEFYHQLAEATAQDTGLKTLPLHFDATIEFNLDPKTKRTIAADARSQGGFKIIVTDEPNEPVIEQKIRGKTSLRLVSVTPATAPSTAKGKKGL